MRGGPEAGPAPECMVAVRACPAPRGRSRDALAAGARGAPRLLPRSTFDLWLEPLEAVSATGSTLVLSAPPAIRAWVERRYGPALVRAIGSRAPALTEVAFVDAAAAGRRRSPNASAGPSRCRSTPATRSSEFVIGPGNRLAHAAALAVAESARRGLQPALPPRPARARQDPPAGRDRRVPAPQPPRARGPLHDRRAVHDRVRRGAPARGPGGVQGALSRARRAVDRRRPGARGQAAHRGGVRPHLQHPALGRQADRALVTTARPRRSRSWPSGSATASTGGCGSSSSLPICGPGSRSSGGSPPGRGPSFPIPACCRRSPPTCPRTSACSRAR